VEFRALGALNAMDGPKDLQSVAQLNLLERLFPGMSSGKRTVAGWVPVLRENNMLKPWRNPINDIDY
jgi:hypothetical protein